MSILTLQLDRNPQRIAKAVDLASREATSFREFPITGPQCSRAHDEIQGSTVATADRKDRRALIGASYAFGPAKAFIGYRWYNGNVGALPTNGSNIYWAGLRYGLTPALTLTGAAYYTDSRNSSADPFLFVASADYAFSKRTDVYMNVGYALNRGNSQLGMNGYNSTTGSPTNVVPGKDQTGVVVGVRHKF